MGHLFEGPVALVDIEEVGGVEPANIDIQPPVVVHVDEGGPLLPDQRGRPVIPHSSLVRDVREFPAAEIAKKPATLGLAHDKNIRPAVAVIISDGHPGAHGAAFELVIELPPHFGVRIVVGGHDAGLLGGQLREHRRPARTGTRRQGSPDDSLRRLRRPGRHSRKPEPRQQSTDDEQFRGTPCRPSNWVCRRVHGARPWSAAPTGESRLRWFRQRPDFPCSHSSGRFTGGCAITESQ